LLVPGPSRHAVSVLHNCIVDKDGNHGNVIGIFSSPKKSVTVEQLVQTFLLPTKPRKLETKTPTLQKFMESTSAEDFSKLEGDEEGEDPTCIEETMPSAIFLPPQLFVSASIEPTMKADVLGTRITLVTATGYSDEDSANSTTDDVC
jgi:hypothetical protein